MRRCADFCCDGRNPAEFMLPERTPTTPHTRRLGFVFTEDVLEQPRRPSAILGCSRTSPEVATDAPSRAIRSVVGRHAAQSATFGAYLPQPWSWSLFGRAVRSSGVRFRRKLARK